MSNNIENLILEQLRVLRGEVQSLRNEVQSMREESREEFHNVKMPLNSLERLVSGFHDDIVIVQGRIDRVDSRIDRIEKRLELTS